MNREQARRLIAAADRLPEALGAGDYYKFEGEGCAVPLCAVGHMAMPFVQGDRSNRFMFALDSLVSAFGFNEVLIVRANDDAPTENRRAAVIAEIERQIREAGHDPAALRAEVAANA